MPTTAYDPDPVISRIENPAVQRAPDLILTNAVCCHEVPGWGSRCNSIN